MKEPRGVILVAVMLALGVLTLAAVPMVAGNSVLPRTGPSLAVPTSPSLSLATCERMAMTAARAGPLVAGPLAGRCILTAVAAGGKTQIWHVAPQHGEGRALELWVTSSAEGVRRVHVRPVPR